MSRARSKVGELGGLYAPRQAPSGEIGDLRWCSFPPGARPRQTPKTTVKPHQGEWGDLRWCSFHPGARAGQTPRRHGTPMAARYTHGGTVHPTAARHTTAAAHGKSPSNSARRGATEGRARRNGNLHKYAIPRALIYGSLTLFNGDFWRQPSLQGSFIVENSCII